MIDKRLYNGMVSDMKAQWKGGTKMEQLAMDSIAEKIYESFNISVPTADDPYDGNIMDESDIESESLT